MDIIHALLRYSKDDNILQGETKCLLPEARLFDFNIHYHTHDI